MQKYTSEQILNKLKTCFQRWFTGLTVQEFLDVLTHLNLLSRTITTSEIPSHLRPEGVLTWLWTNYTTQNPDFTPKIPKVSSPLKIHPWNAKYQIKTSFETDVRPYIALLNRNRAEILLTDEAITIDGHGVGQTYIYYSEQVPNTGLYSNILTDRPFNGTVQGIAWQNNSSKPRTPRPVTNVVNWLTNGASPQNHKVISCNSMLLWGDAYGNSIYSDSLGSSIGSGASSSYTNSTLQLSVSSGFMNSPFADNFMIPGLAANWGRWFQQLNDNNVEIDLVRIDIEPSTTASEFFNTTDNPYKVNNTITTPPVGFTASGALLMDSHYETFSGLLGFHVNTSYPDARYSMGSGYTTTQIFNDVMHSCFMNNFTQALFNPIVNSFPNIQITNFQNQWKCLTVPYSQGNNNWNSPWGIGQVVGRNAGLGTSFYPGIQRNIGNGTQVYNPVHVDWSSGIVQSSYKLKEIGPSGLEADIAWSALLVSLLGALSSQCCSTYGITDFGKFPDEGYQPFIGMTFQEGTLHKMLMGVQVYMDGNGTFNTSGNAEIHNNLAREFNSIINYDKNAIIPIPENYYGDEEINYEYWRKPFIWTTSDIGGSLWTRITPKPDKFNTFSIFASGNGIAAYESTTGRTRYFERGILVNPSFKYASSGYWIRQPNRSELDSNDGGAWNTAKSITFNEIYGINRNFTTIIPGNPTNRNEIFSKGINIPYADGINDGGNYASITRTIMINQAGGFDYKTGQAISFPSGTIVRTTPVDILNKNRNITILTGNFPRHFPMPH